MLSILKKNTLGTINTTSQIISNVFKSQQQKSILLPLTAATNPTTQSVRFASIFAPKRTKYKKAQKGRIPIHIGGSTKGTTVVFGDYGLRVKEGARLTGRQLTAVHNVLKRKLKAVKGARFWMRVFPDIPVTTKGNEVRMGKGKGSFDYWACRVPINRIVFEISGMRKEIAKETFRLASGKLPVKTEFVERGTKPVVGAGFIPPPVKEAPATAATTTGNAAK
ncbi:ribosomal protein L16p/L10e-domain-containing protein [Mycotypha africana]|uniref:ribosomal protein L16p/L10e-domain-containing protein n=1 Tax=Mycotypha africana TaxID=64632 RepID=UPI0023019218|nr:ribosomal protein L16p/L10e-domain-containing protein [Mycotypha africana]KAI8967962.1 ribosomal protein L16p/L10e-domain-containing protein [Mycotypha africana]